MIKNEITIITTGWFPEGDAGAVRLKIMSKILLECGYTVTVLCRGSYNACGNVDNINYISFRNQNGNVFFKVFDYLMFPKKVEKYLKSNVNKIYGVYIYNAHESVFKFCKEFCTSQGIKLFHDCVEWYSPEEYKFGKYDIWYRIKDRINTKIIDKKFCVIAITKFLYDYFNSKGIECIKIPILCDSAKRKNKKEIHSEDKITVFYGGLPGTKDLVGNLLKAALLLEDSCRHKLNIVLVGSTEDYLVNVCGIDKKIIEECKEFTEICGRVSRLEVLEKMEKADFAFLARNAELRYAKAGFPSKVVEALSNATPMLCNMSSDLNEYLIDGYNSIISEDHTPESISKALERAMELTAKERQIMSQNALDTVRKKLDYHNYICVMKEFFDR